MSTINTLLNTDNGADSMADINTNFSNLNTDKLEATDIIGKLNLDQTTPQTVGDTTNRLTKLWATDVDTNQISTVGYIGLPIDGGALTLIDLPQASAGAGTAPIKLISGVLNTTPEIGAIEFDGTDFYLNI